LYVNMKIQCIILSIDKLNGFVFLYVLMYQCVIHMRLCM
jgi:hypothetical protein